MLGRRWVVFIATVVLFVPTAAFADGLGATDGFLFPGMYSQDGSSAFVRPNQATQSVYGVEARSDIGQRTWNMFVGQYSEFLAGKPKKHPHHDHDPVPENWGVSDSLRFFALALLVFGVLTRLKVLRPVIS